ncbi:hypothetical protein IAD21_00591 [Abditibacteriota bacterium]|nr:hypothetical protein IAD21_00591 [Abditibacteriota bacterium]
MNPIYTAGYGGHVARSLTLAARQLDALVVDIRHTPHSKNPGYDQKELIAALDSRYHHLPQLGNVNHANDGGIQLKNVENGIRRVLEMAHARTLILMCGCGDPVGCHRSHVAALLRSRGVESSELVWPSVPELNLKGLPDTAFSILQPWAYLVVNGYKEIENRSWPSRFKGRLLIHAGKGFDLDGWVSLTRSDYWRGICPKLPKLGDFDRGGIVGMTTMTGCVTESESPWFMGEYGFTMKDATPLPFMALRGTRGFFSVQEQLAVMKAPRRELQAA